MNDPELNELIRLEEARRRDTLEMVASESIQDKDSLALQGSVFCGKTAVGHCSKCQVPPYGKMYSWLVWKRIVTLF